MTHAEVNLTATGTGTVRLDGQDVSRAVGGVTVNANMGALTSLLIRVPATEYRFEGQARIEISDPLATLLAAAGWTPPARDPAEDYTADMYRMADDESR